MDKKAKVEQLIIKKASEDKKFLEQLKADPKRAINSLLPEGQKLPDELSISLIQETPNELFLKLPIVESSSDELTEDELNTISAGVESSFLHYLDDMMSAIAVSLTSDRRLKTHIQPIEHALNKLTQLNGVNYKWKQESRGKALETGVIAQEVAAVFPEAVRENHDGYLSVNYLALIAPMIESIKELKRENEELKSQMENFKTTHDNPMPVN